MKRVIQNTPDSEMKGDVERIFLIELVLYCHFLTLAHLGLFLLSNTTRFLCRSLSLS